MSKFATSSCVWACGVAAALACGVGCTIAATPSVAAVNQTDGGTRPADGGVALTPTPDASAVVGTSKACGANEPCCVEGALPGARLVVRGSTCSVKFGSGMSLSIGLVVEAPLKAKVGEGSAFGVEGAKLSWTVRTGEADPPKNPSDGIFVVIGEGKPFTTDPHSCWCDVGPRPSDPTTVVTFPAGDYVYAYPWNGSTWDGPSDTPHAAGPAFPVGSHKAHVSLGVDETHKIVLALPFQVVQ